jgi:hypothetical protein
VYSIATILYELLCGHAVLFPQRVSDVVEALRDNPIAWLDAHAMRNMVPITRYRGCGGLPDALLDVLQRALAKEPKSRPQTAGEMASVLGSILCDDLGALAPATVRVLVPGASPIDAPLVPGRRRLGGREADVALPLAVDDALALLDWSGTPRPVQIRPSGAGVELLRNGARVTRPVYVETGDVFAVGELQFVVIYPE